MNDIIQWVIVGAIVATAAVYLVKRLSRARSGCQCSGKCCHRNPHM